MQNSEDMDGIDMQFHRDPIEDPYAVEKVTCGKGTLYPETCKFLDCKYSPYNSNAQFGCSGCQHKAEESDIGI